MRYSYVVQCPEYSRAMFCDQLMLCELYCNYRPIFKVGQDKSPFRIAANEGTLVFPRGTQWRSWARHCATSRKVAGSIPDGVRPHCSAGVESASNRNEYQEYFLLGVGGECGRYLGLTTLPFSCAYLHEICDHHPPGTLSAWDCFTLMFPDSHTCKAGKVHPCTGTEALCRPYGP